MRALVIDDSKPVRSILARMLRALDFETSEAANGQEGLRLLRELGKPDLATVNWQMPEMDGLQFIRAVRCDARYRELPLLMISSESEPSRVATALAAGANEYIIKPCTQQVLAETLARLGLSAARPSPQSPAPTAGNHRRAGRTIRILIVDDSVVVRRVVASVLAEDPDLEVVGTAADGRMALERLQALHPDVVLLDVEMPILNGLDTLKALRKTHPNLAVIMFSSLTERGAAVTTDALLLGANDYVAKPGGTHMKDPEAGRRTIREELIPKIKQLASKETRDGRQRNTLAIQPPASRPVDRASGRCGHRVVDGRPLCAGSDLAPDRGRLSRTDCHRPAHAATVYEAPGRSPGGGRSIRHSRRPVTVNCCRRAKCELHPGVST